MNLPRIPNLKERALPEGCERSARYTALIWVNLGLEAVIIYLDEMLAGGAGAAHTVWLAWKDRNMLESGFDQHDIPGDEGLYIMDITLFKRPLGGVGQQVNNIGKYGLRTPKRWQAAWVEP